MNWISLGKLKREQLLKTFFAPFILPVVIVIFAIICQWKIPIYLAWIDFAGLMVTTIGAILALRPLVRSFLHPKISERQKRKRDINAGVMAFVYVFAGFSLQLIVKLYPIVALWVDGTPNWIFITIGTDIVYFVLVRNTLRKFDII